MDNKELTDKLDIILGCLIGSHIGNATPEHQLENLITELKANNNEVLGDVSERELTGKDLIEFTKWIINKGYEHRFEIIPNQLIKFYLNSRDSIIENNNVR